MPRTFKRRSEFERQEAARIKRVLAVEECRGSWLIEGWLRRGQVRTLSGGPKTGKTVYAAQIAVRVSQGLPIGGQMVCRTNVLYLATDASSLEWSVGVLPYVPEPDPWFHVEFGSWNLDNPKHLFLLREWIEFGGVGLVVIDPLIMATPRVDYARLILKIEKLCREKNAAAIVVV